VIVTGLDGDFKRQAFGSVLQIIPMAESVKKLNSVCMGCGVLAAFTERLETQQTTKQNGS